MKSNAIKLTLIGDGSSDKALLKIVDWVIGDRFPRINVDMVFAEFSKFRKPPLKSDVQRQIDFAKENFSI